jgi:iron complex outermembrane receptor protein
MLNIPLATDQLAVRVVGYGRRVDGLVDLPAINLKRSDAEKTYGGRVELLAKLGASTSVLLSAIYQNTKLDDVNRVSVSTDSRPDPVREPFQDELKLLNLTIEQGVGFGKITATASTYQRNTAFTYDVSQFVAPNYASVSQKNQIEGTTGEVRFSSDLKGPFQFIGGLFYEKRDLSGFNNGFIVNPADGLPFRPNLTFFISKQYENVVNKAAFVNASLDVTSKLSVEGGIRFYDLKSTSGSTLIQDPFGRPLGPTPTLRSDATGNVKKLRVSYQANKSFLVYGTFSEGFREGGANPIGLVTGAFPLTFKPDLVKNYELGWKSKLFDRQFTLNGAVYYMSWNDIQVLQTDSTGAFGFTINGGKASLKGVELEGRLTPRAIPGFAANFSVRYSDQKLTQDQPLFPGAAPNPFAGRDGDRIPYTSKVAANLGIEQGFKLASLNGFARVDVAYIGKSYTTFRAADPLYRTMGDYALVDFRTGLSRSTWDASIYVKNILNKRGINEWTVEAGLTDRVRTTDPREAGVELTFRF